MDKKIVDRVIFLGLFGLITFLSVFTGLSDIDFNAKLMHMILVVVLSIVIVIRYRTLGAAYVSLLYLIGAISIASTCGFDHLHYNGVMAFQVSMILSVLVLNRYVNRSKQALEKLYQDSIIDDVTGVYNKRYFNKRLIEEFQRAQRNHERLSLTIMDINKFKSINDTHGHLFGDCLLRTFGQEMEKRIRRHDVFCRFGGDEFVLLINHPDDDIKDHIRQKISEVCELMNKTYGHVLKHDFSVSAGMALYPDDSQDSGDLFLKADMAMYEAKKVSNIFIM